MNQQFVELQVNMKRKFFHSTVFKITALMLSISLVAILSMFSSVFISDKAQQDAEAVNVAGSLRMQSFRLMSYLQSAERDNEKLKQLVAKFEHDLSSGILINPTTFNDSAQLHHEHTAVTQKWHAEIKPLLLRSMTPGPDTSTALYTAIDSFVGDIEALVNAYQLHAESNIQTIRLIQMLALFGMLLMITIAIFIINRQIEQPLSKLTAVARQIGRGDFTAYADESGKDELAVLAKTMNAMSADMYRSQTQLEEQVKRKTRKLSRSNESLDLLFHISRKLNEVPPHSVDYAPILKSLSKVTGVEDLDLCIMTAQGNGPYEHLMSTQKDLPAKCIAQQCGGCTEHTNLFPTTDNEMKYQLKFGEANFGVLVVRVGDNSSLEEWQHQLFESVAEQIANSLSLKHQNEQNRRMALMNERTVIARELHDSLAQALSYLKIQVTRLQRLRDKENSQQQMDNVINELKSGLAAAYSELRELLTTFRLKLDGQGIKAALEETISHLQSRSEDFTFSVNYQVGNVPFTPNEEIHLLQIAREATQNAFYHSQGSHIEIDIHSNALSEVILMVKDNGIGIPDNPNKLNHYGLAIMQERSRNLEGDLSIKPNNDGGTIVKFTFMPEYAKNIELKSKSA